MLRLAVFFLTLAIALPGTAAERGEISHAVLKSVVGLKVDVPIEARTARSLGFEREGSGVVISSDGLVLTVGYLIMEAETVEIRVGTPDDYAAIPARPLAYDHDSGFGLLRASKPLNVEPARLGVSADVARDDAGLAVSFSGYRTITPVRIVDRRPFAGYWEYMTDSAIFTMPPHLHYGGAALFNAEGYLVGIGSLFVNDAMERDSPAPGNLFLGVDALKPILGELVATGRRRDAPNPWLGVSATEMGGRLVVTRVRDESPAYGAGMQRGDIIVGVNGRRVTTLQDFFTRAWAQGRAGVTVTLDVLRRDTADMGVEQIEVESIDRSEWLMPFGGGE